MTCATTRLLSICPALVLSYFIAPPALALVLISETRSVTASYYGAGIETISSPGTFGTFAATAVGTPFGGGYVLASQTSNLTSSVIEVAHALDDFYGPGGWAASNFQVSFSLPQSARITISGISAYFSGPASLVSESEGAIPLIWGPDTFYRNTLDFNQVLGPGIYTFTSNETLRGDGIRTRLTLREVVPDRGHTGWMLAVGVVALIALRRKSGSRTSRRGEVGRR